MNPSVDSQLQSTTDDEQTGRAARSFDAALTQLESAKPFAKPRYQTEVFRLATELLDSQTGIRSLYDEAHRYEAAGVFYGGPWEDAGSLQPALVGGCLRGDGSIPTLEALSELRILACAQGREAAAKNLEADSARQFLRDIVALNLELLFPEDSEESRLRPRLMGRAFRLFALIGAELSLDGLRQEVTDEVLDLAAQQPILTDRITKLTRLAQKLPAADSSSGPDPLEPFQDALQGPSPLSRELRDPVDYRAALSDLSRDQLAEEARLFAASLRTTGVGNPLHPVLLRRLVKLAPDLVSEALALNAVGQAELEQNEELAHSLIKVAILPATVDAVFGFSRVLERGLLSRQEVAGGLRRLVELDIETNAKRMLLASRPKNAGLTANAVLVAGALSVLGQPLGIGQGANPTCQAARGISLWGTHAPGMLLDMVAHAARDGLIELDFEGQRFKSSEVGTGISPADTTLDPVQVVLVPHLDRSYEEMLRRASLRNEDAHKWVNPALYGRWVHNGFASVVDPYQKAIREYADFVRRFYATHHPSFNDGYQLIYPNPVGLFVTDVRGRFLGPHAVSIQRIAKDALDELRVYFFNPNNDGRQRWGQGVTPTVRGHGEEPGESSLPFHQFASRLYAFHYNPYEEGDAYAVPQSIVDEVENLAKSSWGEAFKWE